MSRKFGITAMWGILLTVVLALLIGACDLAGLSETTGSIEIKVKNTDGAKTLIPNMTPAKYTISGSGPSGASFSGVEITSTSTMKTGLTKGEWTITVEAFNNENVKIGEGSNTVTVMPRTTASVSVSVTPISGNGSLSISLQWPDGSIASPGVTVSLTPIGGGTAVNPTSGPTISGSTATVTWDNNVPAGYYTLSIQLKDGSNVVGGKADSVRILSGLTTTGSYAWTVVQPGKLEVSITPELNNPLTVSISSTDSDISISGTTATLAEGQTADLTASASGGTGTITYTWYIDGTQVGTGATYTVGSGWFAGEYYQVDVIATDGSTPVKTGSATLGVTVE